eukprot:1495699-Amphidinium_carterae.2
MSNSGLDPNVVASCPGWGVKRSGPGAQTLLARTFSELVLWGIRLDYGRTKCVKRVLTGSNKIWTNKYGSLLCVVHEE